MRRIVAALVGAATLFGASPASAAPDLSSCGAEEFTRYIGAPVEALKRVRQDDVRYACAGCAMTMEYNTGRLTVVYDRKTDRIMRLGCN
jgi:membrane-bound inhibitor of C-type lysozyme